MRRRRRGGGEGEEEEGCDFVERDISAAFFIQYLGRPGITKKNFVSLQGLIKIRGDQCWRDLTCMNYHYEVSSQ